MAINSPFMGINSSTWAINGPERSRFCIAAVHNHNAHRLFLQACPPLHESQLGAGAAALMWGGKRALVYSSQPIHPKKCRKNRKKNKKEENPTFLYVFAFSPELLIFSAELMA